jgi:hypothetical protein
MEAFRALPAAKEAKDSGPPGCALSPSFRTISGHKHYGMYYYGVYSTT